MYVVCDIANLPFMKGAFGGIVSLHTIHHLPEGEHLQAYQELYRVLEPESSAVVVNGWPSSSLMNLADPLIRSSNRVRGLIRRLSGNQRPSPPAGNEKPQTPAAEQKDRKQKGTFTERHDVEWLKEQVGASMPVNILVWRSVSVRFLRSLIHPHMGGRHWLRLLFWLEERFPHFFGEQGQYPLVILTKGDRPETIMESK
jgi:hypothetical protein